MIARNRLEYTASRAEKHIASLDGIRALSILLVLACHMLPLGPKQLELNPTAGALGMTLFFGLSGFLITRFLWKNQDIPTFLVRRIARIAPLVVLVTAIYCLILQYRPDSFIAANLYVLNYWHSALNPWISPLWSLGVEMQFYLAIALAVALFRRYAFWLVGIGAVVVTGLRIDLDVFANIQTHLRVDEILAGSLIAVAYENRHSGWVKSCWRWLPMAFWPVFLLLLLSSSPLFPPFYYFRPYFAALFIGSILAMNDTWQTRLLSLRGLGYIATISFALYVWHSPFRHFWFDEGTTLERYLFKRPLAFLCLFALAHMSTFYFEKPILRLARKFPGRRVGPSASDTARRDVGA